MRRNRIAAIAALAVALIGARATATAAPEPATARPDYRWEHSPHGPLLERILPPTVEPQKLPEPNSKGARLVVAYCVQCHYLPNPAMHTAARWPPLVERMVWRMEGKGNLGALMEEMMADVKAPSEHEQATLVRYLQKYAQREIDARKYPDLKSQPGQMFAIACSQCHALPDPREWPQVVERMQRNMAWANRVTGDPALRTSPELNTLEIVRFLQRNSRTH